KAVHNMGNVKDSSPLEIFNSDKFNNIRKLHSEGNKTKIDMCKNCTVLYSENKQRRY
ncbi:MAG: SPASM domain-containing protein, partial [Nanoarchaeota archaeon]|nr:SPASM domain-containing protein [Nanoarchaeota archaeon]